MSQHGSRARSAILTSSKLDTPQRFYSVAEVAVMFGMSAMTVYRAIAAGEFPAVKVRGRLIIPARVVDAMSDAALAGHTVVDAATWVTDDVAGR